jgi:hypothetical protein
MDAPAHGDHRSFGSANSRSRRSGRGLWLAACSAAAAAWWSAASGALPPDLVVHTSVGNPSRAGAPIVSGDLIVKFRDATEPGKELAAVLAGQRTVASVAPLAARLSSELGLPLVLVQVTSGREALLALDREALARVLTALAQQQPEVQRASPASPAAAAGAAPPAGLPAAQWGLRLQLRASRAAPELAQLARRLAAGGLVAPRLKAEGGAAAAGTYLALYDLDALTLALMTKVQQRPDVEYVQPNRLLRPAGAASR